MSVRKDVTVCNCNARACTCTPYRGHGCLGCSCPAHVMLGLKQDQFAVEVIDGTGEKA